MKVADMHCDTIGVIYENRLLGNNLALKENNLHLDIKKMKKADYLLQTNELYFLPNDMDSILVLINYPISQCMMSTLKYLPAANFIEYLLPIVFSFVT